MTSRRFYVIILVLVFCHLGVNVFNDFGEMGFLI